MMIKKVAFTAYKVRDLDRARNFYERVLGLKPGANFNDQWQEYDLPGGGCFAITTYGDDDWQPSSTHGGSVAFEVEDIETMCRHLKDQGIKFKMDIFESPVCKMAIIVDSEGNALMLHELHRKS